MSSGASASRTAATTCCGANGAGVSLATLPSGLVTTRVGWAFFFSDASPSTQSASFDVSPPRAEVAVLQVRWGRAYAAPPDEAAECLDAGVPGGLASRDAVAGQDDRRFRL